MMLASIKIRKALREDLPAIIALSEQLLAYDHAFDESIDLRWIHSPSGLEFISSRIEQDDGLVLVAEQAAKIIGFLVGGLVAADSYRSIKKLSELEEIFVLDAYRSNKVGSQLMQKFFAWSKEQGAEKLSVKVSAANQRAIKLYQLQNFIPYDLVLEREID